MRRFALALALLLMASVGGFGAPLYRYQDFNFTSLSLNFDNTFNIDKFDLAGYTLDRVTITAEGRFGGSVLYTNTNDLAGSVTLRGVDVEMELRAPLVTSFGTLTLVLAPPTYTFSAATRTRPVAASGTTTFNIPTTDWYAASPFSSSNSGDLAMFTGAGTIPLRYISGMFFNEGNIGSPEYRRDPNLTGGFRGSVEYMYHAATPEPATMALIGSGLLGLGFLLRRRIVR